jgi:hypothetical protein
MPTLMERHHPVDHLILHHAAGTVQDLNLSGMSFLNIWMNTRQATQKEST